MSAAIILLSTSHYCSVDVSQAHVATVYTVVDVTFLSVDASLVHVGSGVYC